jgi:hypothetical protein
VRRRRRSRQACRALAQGVHPLPRKLTAWSWWSRHTNRVDGCVFVSSSSVRSLVVSSCRVTRRHVVVLVVSQSVSRVCVCVVCVVCVCRVCVCVVCVCVSCVTRSVSRVVVSLSCHSSSSVSGQSSCVSCRHSLSRVTRHRRVWPHVSHCRQTVALIARHDVDTVSSNGRGARSCAVG